MSIYSLLPKTNCRKCGEQSCMTFAARLYKNEVGIEDCAPLGEEAFARNKGKLLVLCA